MFSQIFKALRVKRLFLRTHYLKEQFQWKSFMLFMLFNDCKKRIIKTIGFKGAIQSKHRVLCRTSYMFWKKKQGISVMNLRHQKCITNKDFIELGLNLWSSTNFTRSSTKIISPFELSFDLMFASLCRIYLLALVLIIVFLGKH